MTISDPHPATGDPRKHPDLGQGRVPQNKMKKKGGGGGGGLCHEKGWKRWHKQKGPAGV